MTDRAPSSSGSGSGSGASSSSLVVYSVYLINKAGGLIYQKDFSPLAKRDTNAYLRLASTFHSLHAITAKGIHVAPLNDKKAAAIANMQDPLPRNQEGIQSFEAKDFRLQCYQTLTGLKFLLIASPNFSAATLEKILQSVYGAYTDYVLKNPFYELEMPIRLEQFDTALQKLVQGAMGHSLHGSQDRRDR